MKGAQWKMGSFRSGRGGRGRGRGGRPGVRGERPGGASGGDFRWKKGNNKRKREDAQFHESGDSIPAEELGVSSGLIPVASGGGKADKEKNASIKARQRNAKKRRRQMHEQEREQSDEMIRSSPAKFLWEKYLEWECGKLTHVEKKVDKWTQEHVVSVEERPDTTLIQLVKEVVGPDYITQGEWKKRANAVPGVACIALASSALRAVQLGKSVYDGRPVGKLFSKHIKIEVQHEWLKRCCKDGLAPSAAGTAKRVQRLIEEGAMTLKHTSALVVDFHRDEKLRNILDFPTSREELFDFLHKHARPLIAEGRMKVVLFAPTPRDTSTQEAATDGTDERKEDDVSKETAMS